MAESYKFGPCGGSGGANSYDGGEYVNDTIMTLAFYYSANDEALTSMTISYDSKEQLTAGTPSGGVLTTITLKPGELIMAVEGQWCPSAAMTGCICYLAFTTTLGTNPVFGGGTSTNFVTFNFQAPPEYFIQGFFGNSGSYLDSIGVYLTTGPTS